MIIQAEPKRIILAIIGVDEKSSQHGEGISYGIADAAQKTLEKNADGVSFELPDNSIIIAAGETL
jgi:hypothetical protein